VSALLSVVWFNISIWFISTVKRAGTKFVFGSHLVVSEVSRVIYEDYLPAALAESKHLTARTSQVDEKASGMSRKLWIPLRGKGRIMLDP